MLLALDGLHPPSMGARVSFAGGKPKVTDGPFAEAKEVLGGYWMIQVKSKEEAIEWAVALPRLGQRSDRGPPGAGVRGLPRRRAGGRGRVPRDAGDRPEGAQARSTTRSAAESRERHRRRRHDDAIHGADQGHQGLEAGVMPNEKLLTEMGEVQRGAGEGRHHARRRRAHPSSKGARVKFSGGEADRDRRTVRRDEGADRRLLALAGEVEGRGDRVGQALPQSHRRGRPRSRSARCSRPRTSAPSSRPSSGAGGAPASAARRAARSR